MEDPTQVVLAGGSPLLRAGLVETLSQDGSIRVLGDTHDVADIAMALARFAPRVLLAYLERPALAAPQVVDAVAASPSVAGCLILTGSRESADLLTALGAGVLGYGVLDSLPLRDLVAAVLTVGRGDVWLCPWSTQHLLTRALAWPSARPDKNTASPDGSDLSSREMEVLQLLAKGTAEHEMSETLFLSRNTVKTYVRRIREKLGVSTRSDALRVAYLLGIIPDRRQPPRAPSAVHGKPAHEQAQPGPRGRTA